MTHNCSGVQPEHKLIKLRKFSVQTAGSFYAVWKRLIRAERGKSYRRDPSENSK